MTKTPTKRQRYTPPSGNAICYSGYRRHQSPQDESFPSYEEIAEDLSILVSQWQFLRLYDCSVHAKRVLDVIKTEQLPLQVMLGANMRAEHSNPNCPWGANFTEAQLLKNRDANAQEIEDMIALAKAHPTTVFSVSVGNEASVEWSDHQVSVEQLILYVRRIKAEIQQPVTFCENYVPWSDKLAPLVAELDFISLHTYPVWEYKAIDIALDYTKDNYYTVAERYPDTPVVITEAGWATASNGRGIETWNASQDLQAIYYKALMEWTHDADILTFVFEAFDEPWKGSSEELEPEKHWGLFTVDRQPKLVMQEIFAHLIPT